MPAGFTAKAGFKREADIFSRVWPSASPATITELLPLISEDVNVVNDQNSIITKDGQSVPERPKLIRRSVDGDVVIDLHYEGIEFFLTAGMGQVANRIGGVLMPEDINGDGTAYRHIIELESLLKQDGWRAGDGFLAGDPPTGDGLVAGQQKLRRGTFSVFKGATVWDTLSCMINDLRFEMNGNNVQVTGAMIGYSQDFDSTTNSGITALNNCPNTKITFHEGILAFREIDGGAITITDTVGAIVSFNLQVLNNLQVINTKDTGVNIDEPQKSGVTQVSGTFSLPRFNNLDMITRNRDEVRGHMLLEFKAGIIPGSTGPDNYTMRFWFPNITLTGGEVSIQDQATIQQNYAFFAAEPDDDLDPPGFPTSTRQSALLIEIINAEAAHPLLD